MDGHTHCSAVKLLASNINVLSNTTGVAIEYGEEQH
jgi:hypothetical protein